MWRWANEIAALGMGIIGFDAPLHGFRTDRPRSSATNFINIVDPAIVVDNFRQAEAEHAFLLRVIDALAELDLLGDGQTALDKGDPTNFGHLARDKQVLLMQAMQDE